MLESLHKNGRQNSSTADNIGFDQGWKNQMLTDTKQAWEMCKLG